MYNYCTKFCSDSLRVIFLWFAMGGLDDVEQSEDEVRDDPEHETDDGPEEEQALGSETCGDPNSQWCLRTLISARLDDN